MPHSHRPKPLVVSVALIAPVSKLAAAGKADTIISSIALSDSKMTILDCAILALNGLRSWRCDSLINSASIKSLAA